MSRIPPTKSPSFRRCCSYRHHMSLYPESLLLNNHVTYMASSVAASPRHLQAFCIRSHSLFKVSCSSWPAEMAELTELFNWTQFVLGDSFWNMIFSSMRCFMNAILEYVQVIICSWFHQKPPVMSTSMKRQPPTASHQPRTATAASQAACQASVVGTYVDKDKKTPLQFQLLPGNKTPLLQTLVPCLQFKTMLHLQYMNCFVQYWVMHIFFIVVIIQGHEHMIAVATNGCLKTPRLTAEMTTTCNHHGWLKQKNPNWQSSLIIKQLPPINSLRPIFPLHPDCSSSEQLP